MSATYAGADLRAYLGPRLDVLRAAVDARDGQAAMGVVELIRAEGHTEVADFILNYLVDEGLRNMAAGAGR